MKRLVAAGMLVAGSAHADPPPEPKPDPSAVEAGDANLESTERRQGLNVTLALGGGMTLGFGIEGSVGRGGSGSFRIGERATTHTVITLEAAGVALFHAVKTTSGMSELKTNKDSNILLGGQYFVNSALWVRGAVGFGVYKTQEIGDGITLVGPAVAVGAGFDLARWRRIGVGLEVMSISMMNRDGVLSSSGFMLDLSVD